MRPLRRALHCDKPQCHQGTPDRPWHWLNNTRKVQGNPISHPCARFARHCRFVRISVISLRLRCQAVNSYERHAKLILSCRRSQGTIGIASLEPVLRLQNAELGSDLGPVRRSSVPPELVVPLRDNGAIPFEIRRRDTVTVFLDFEFHLDAFLRPSSKIISEHYDNKMNEYKQGLHLLQSVQPRPPPLWESHGSLHTRGMLVTYSSARNQGYRPPGRCNGGRYWMTSGVQWDETHVT